jgi:hypothetical protein
LIVKRIKFDVNCQRVGAPISTLVAICSSSPNPSNEPKIDLWR